MPGNPQDNPPPPDELDDLELSEELARAERGEVTMKINLPRGRRTQRVVVPTVRVVAGPDMLQFVTLTPGQDLVIGRDDAAGMILSDGSVSRLHARLRCEDTGDITLHDLGSTNGTTINGQAVHRAQLRPGDQFDVGAVSLRVDLLGLDELHHISRVLERLNAAGTDPLTGLQTRGYLEERLPGLMARLEESRLPLSVIFCDVDRFKSINDTFGHAVGDQVLSAISRLFLVDVRDSDVCVRYGGEELLVFLPGSDERGAGEVAERLRRTVATHDWARTAVGLRVTASFGVAERATDEDSTRWIDRADRAMYLAKQGGRNLVRLASNLG